MGKSWICYGRNVNAWKLDFKKYTLKYISLLVFYDNTAVHSWKTVKNASNLNATFSTF